MLLFLALLYIQEEKHKGAKAKVHAPLGCNILNGALYFMVPPVPSCTSSSMFLRTHLGFPSAARFYLPMLVSILLFLALITLTTTSLLDTNVILRCKYILGQYIS